MQLLCLEHVFFRADLFGHFLFFNRSPVIMPLHPQVSRGVVVELKGSSAGIFFYLKADLIFCAFVYDVLL